MIGQQLRFLADENFRLPIVEGLRRLHALIDIVTVEEARLQGKPDPEILAFAADTGRILLTHDVSTMPDHLRDFLARGRHSPGVFLIAQQAPIGPVIDVLYLVWNASESAEWLDHFVFFP